jgi:hypothetical protein
MPSPEPPLGDGAAVRWSRFKIATNVVGRHLLTPEPRQPPGSVLSQRKQRQCVLMGRSGYQQRSAWDLIQLRAWTGPMEKMSHRGEGPIWRRTAERQAEFRLHQASAERWQPRVVRRSRLVEL